MEQPKTQLIRKSEIRNPFQDERFAFGSSWDCWAEGQVLELYVRKYGPPDDRRPMKDRVLGMVSDINSALNAGPDALRSRFNRQSDYWKKGNKTDHRHFHTIEEHNQKHSAKMDVPLPQHLTDREAVERRKRSFDLCFKDVSVVDLQWTFF